MSYPRKLQVLIIEDEQSVKDTYEELFETLAREFDVVRPTFARSYDEAVTALEDPTIYHLVILDLGLPWTPRQPAVDGLEPGINLLTKMTERNGHPIPVLLVISGRLNRAKFSELQERLDAGFWHAQFVNKGVDEEEAIRTGIKKAHVYCDLGIHVRDGEKRLAPNLSPREEDLLRRCILHQSQCIGVDIEWWDYSSNDFSNATPDMAGWTKVFMGSFLLDDGFGRSRPTFFKFEPSGNAALVHRDATILHQKLSHIKVCCSISSGTRCLLATQKVGELSERPISLAEFLNEDPTTMHAGIEEVVGDIGDQLDRLGSLSQDQITVSKALWAFHDRTRLLAMWRAHYPPDSLPPLDADVDPIADFDTLAASQTRVWVRKRGCSHGDLHLTNIALEREWDRSKAYIFDASGVKADIAMRDMAMLEVASIIHQEEPTALIRICEPLYRDFILPPEDLPQPAGRDVERNTFELIRQIRQLTLRNEERSDQALYALLVFDYALIQMGGMYFGTPGNKITNPSIAAYFCGVIARWLRRMAPEYFPMPKLSP